MLFKHFEVKGPADRALIYLTLYTTQCLQKLEKCPSQIEAVKLLTAMSHEAFRSPGDTGFSLGSFFPGPATPQEGEMCRSYLKQIREELGRRLVAKVYGEDGQPSKFWIVFAKRKVSTRPLRHRLAMCCPSSRLTRHACLPFSPACVPCLSPVHEQDSLRRLCVFARIARVETRAIVAVTPLACCDESVPWTTSRRWARSPHRDATITHQARRYRARTGRSRSRVRSADARSSISARGAR